MWQSPSQPQRIHPYMCARRPRLSFLLSQLWAEFLAASLSTSDRTCPTSPSFTLSASASSDPASFSTLLLQPFLSGPPSSFTFPSPSLTLSLSQFPRPLSLFLIPCLLLSPSPHFMQRWGYLRDWVSMEKISFGTMNWVRGRGEKGGGGMVGWGGVGHGRGGRGEWN